MPTKDRPEYESDVYDNEGDAYTEAWNIMREHITNPPSLDVFQKGLADSHTDKPQLWARYLVDLRKGKA